MNKHKQPHISGGSANAFKTKVVLKERGGFEKQRKGHHEGLIQNIYFRRFGRPSVVSEQTTAPGVPLV